jgi:hypothetical protein
MGLTLRTIKGTRLTHEELDGNFRFLTGSHEVSGSIVAVAFSGSFSGSFEGDGSGLTGVVAAADLTGTAVISGSAQIAELNAGIISGSAQLPAGIISGSVQLDGEVFGFTSEIVASGSFSGSFVGDGSGLTGISAAGSLEGAGFMGGATIDLTDLNTLKRDNLIVHQSNVTINIPLASNFALGTVVEFDIFIPTGSTWTLSIDPSIASPVGGFMLQGYRGFNQVDFNPSFAPWFGPYRYFGFPGSYNGYGGSFGSLDGDFNHEGPALVRLVAVANSFDPTNPTTPATNPMGYLWLGRIIARQPMSNSVGTVLSVETVSVLPATDNSTGDLVMFDDGISGLKLHVYNGTGWDAV